MTCRSFTSWAGADRTYGGGSCPPSKIEYRTTFRAVTPKEYSKAASQRVSGETPLPPAFGKRSSPHVIFVNCRQAVAFPLLKESLPVSGERFFLR